MTNLNQISLDTHLLEAKKLHKRIIVDALIYNEKGEIFAQKRSPFRLKHPNCWDLPGGHLEGEESLLECLSREIREELSVEVQEVVTLLDIFDFEMDQSMLKDDELSSERIFQFLVKVKDWNSMKLEEGKAVEYKWFTRANVDLTMENRSEMNLITYIRDAIIKAFDYLEKNSI